MLIRMVGSHAEEFVNIVLIVEFRTTVGQMSARSMIACVAYCPIDTWLW